MITQLFNDFANFLNSLFILYLMWYVLKFILRFRYGFRFHGFRKANYRKSGLRTSLSCSKAEYDFKKFKYQQKMEYKLKKYQIKLQMKEDRKKSGKEASFRLPYYLRIVK